MKALTLTQPWATLVAMGAKTVETRGWSTKYRGVIAIHAAKGFPAWAKDVAQNTRVFRDALGWPNPPEGTPLTQEWIDEIARRLRALPLGKVIATAVVIDCFSTDGKIPPLSDRELAFGNYAPGRSGWILEDVRPLAEPIPAKGALSLWEWTVPPGVRL